MFVFYKSQHYKVRSRINFNLECYPDPVEVAEMDKAGPTSKLVAQKQDPLMAAPPLGRIRAARRNPSAAAEQPGPLLTRVERTDCS